MKHAGEIFLGILVMLLAVLGVWEFTIISSLKTEVKAKQLMIDAQAVRARDLQEQIVEKDQTIKLLSQPPIQQPVAPAVRPSQPAPVTSQPAQAVKQPTQVVKQPAATVK